MSKTLRILGFFPLAALAARSLVVLIAVVSAGGESFAEVVANPVAGIVRGTETPGPDYAPPQIGNGELNTTVDWLGGSSHPSPCSRGFFLAARRIIQPKRELFGQGRIETVVETNGRRCAKPVSWEQQLDIRTGVNRNRNVYADDVRLESEMFVPLAENTFCVRQTFVNGGRSACRVRGGIAFAHPTHERMVGGWERQDGRFRHVNRTYGFRIVDSVTDVVAGEAVIGKCTDLERLGPARDRPFLTTCGAIYAMRIAAKAAALLKLDAEEAADFVTCAARLEKGLPQRDGRFTGYLGCREETVGQLGGFYPYPIFPFDHPAQRKAAEAFMTGGAASGNMYPTGRRICPWYAAKMAATLNEMHEGAAAVAWLRTAAESRGLFGEYWEIREPGQYFHPWFTTAAGSTLFALNGILVADSGDETRLACGVPKEWTDYAFRLPTRRGVTVEMVVKGGRLEKLELTPRTPGKSHPMTVVLPEGLRKPSRFTVDVR